MSACKGAGDRKNGGSRLGKAEKRPGVKCLGQHVNEELNVPYDGVR